MPNFLFVILLHIIPLLLLSIPFFLLFDVRLKHPRKATSPAIPKTPPLNINELEEKLKNLIETNKLNAKTDTLVQELQKTSTHTIAAYLELNKKDLKGFHLFQLIFSLIKNNAEDQKIIKILRHYLPSCATSHLYALLHSFKVFLNISERDGTKKDLIRELNQNRVRTTLLYLEKKINQTLNAVASAPPAKQQSVIDTAAIYGLIFAAFAEFYDNDSTEKILRLANFLSPELFKYWHTVPQTAEKETAKPAPRPLKTKIPSERSIN